MSLIDSPENGATEIPGTSNDSLFVFLAGPIRYWWTPGVEGTRLHTLYLHQRNLVHQELSGDFLVYAPHRAWRGPWNGAAQKINDLAVITCDAFVWIQVPGVRAWGTYEELLLARDKNKPIFPLIISDDHDVSAQLEELKLALHTLDSERKAWR